MYKFRGNQGLNPEDLEDDEDDDSSRRSKGRGGKKKKSFAIKPANKQRVAPRMSDNDDVPDSPENNSAVISSFNVDSVKEFIRNKAFEKAQSYYDK